MAVYGTFMFFPRCFLMKQIKCSVQAPYKALTATTYCMPHCLIARSDRAAFLSIYWDLDFNWLYRCDETSPQN